MHRDNAPVMAGGPGAEVGKKRFAPPSYGISMSIQPGLCMLLQMRRDFIEEVHIQRPPEWYRHSRQIRNDRIAPGSLSTYRNSSKNSGMRHVTGNIWRRTVVHKILCACRPVLFERVADMPRAGDAERVKNLSWLRAKIVYYSGVRIHNGT